MISRKICQKTEMISKTIKFDIQNMLHLKQYLNKQKCMFQIIKCYIKNEKKYEKAKKK